MSSWNEMVQLGRMGEEVYKGKYAKALRRGHAVGAKYGPKLVSRFKRYLANRGGVKTRSYGTTARRRSYKNYNGPTVLRKSFCKNYKGKNKMYSKTLKHILCEPRSKKYTVATNIADIGTNSQGNCAWYVFRGLSPSDYDTMLAEGYGGAIATVPASFNVLRDICSLQTTLKNNSDRQCDLTVWKCTARRDIPSSVANVSGVNPALLLQGFTDASVISGTSAIAYNDYGSTPYLSPAWCSLLNTKQVVHKSLVPGEQIVLKQCVKKPVVISKQKFGITATGSIAAAFKYLRELGSFLLIRVQGSIVHDESTVAYPLSSGALTVSTSGFNLDVLNEYSYTYRVPFSIPTRQTGQTAVLTSTMALGNEQGFNTQAADEPSTGA